MPRPGKTDGQTVVLVRDLVKRFGTLTAVNGISFSVDRGEIFGFLGPNGSGKSTTIRMLCGILDPTGGTAEVMGYDVTKDPERIKQRIGYMSQKFSLYDDLTVDENLEFYGGVYGVTGPEFCDQRARILKMADLTGREGELAANLSVGWKQRLALGCAIIHRPDVIFLDEPTAGVDPVSRRHFWDLLYDKAEEGVGLMVTTHYMDEAEHCNELAFIYQGDIIARGTPAEIRHEQMRGEVIEVDCPEPEKALELLSTRPEFTEVVVHGDMVHVATGNAREAAVAVQVVLEQAGLGTCKTSPIEPSLEDVFVSLIEERELEGGVRQAFSDQVP